VGESDERARSPVVDPGPPPARSGLKTGRIAALVVFALAGLLFSTSALTADGADLRATGRTDLADLIRDRERTVRNLETEVGAVRDQLEAATDDETSAELDAVREQADNLATIAGLTPAQGPALTITLDDSPDAPHDGPPPDGLSLDDFVVHQQDIEAVVNALWAGGAEAMTIMDQRVIGTSAVRCVGSVLSLHGRTYSPPYRITAIGDPTALQDALDSSPAVSIYREYARELGLGYDVSPELDTTMPPYEGSLSLQWASAG
jgi:uncharacterized protein YlxW (UPF0749 family)